MPHQAMIDQLKYATTLLVPDPTKLLQAKTLIEEQIKKLQIEDDAAPKPQGYVSYYE